MKYDAVASTIRVSLLSSRFGSCSKIVLKEKKRLMFPIVNANGVYFLRRAFIFIKLIKYTRETRKTHILMQRVSIIHLIAQTWIHMKMSCADCFSKYFQWNLAVGYKFCQDHNVLLFVFVSSSHHLSIISFHIRVN